MATFNKVILVGRLTRDPECRTFNNGGKVARLGFAVTNRRKNAQSGQWEDEPMFIDCEAFNRGESGHLADTIEKHCTKGSQILIEGKLHLDTWDDKATGQKRQKHKIVIDTMQLLDGKPAQGQPDTRPPAEQSSQPQPSQQQPQQQAWTPSTGEEIPF